MKRETEKRKFLNVLGCLEKHGKVFTSKENKKNYLMMFEFEKTELIDGRWKEEIDQIRF